MEQGDGLEAVVVVQGSVLTYMLLVGVGGQDTDRSSLAALDICL